jgi:hypothetical protein
MAQGAIASPAQPSGFWRRTRTIALIWLGWAILLFAFQAYVRERFDLVRPDNATDWTSSWTDDDSLENHPYLRDPTLAGHAAWDSEFYISIALHGYEDPAMRVAGPKSTSDDPQESLKRYQPTWISLNHAFFPGYPLLMGLVARPLIAVGVEPVGAAIIAGVVISLLGALGAMIALGDLAADPEAPGDGPRAAFYLAIWPAAVFMAQVYSEGLFLALSFGALAFLKRDRWGWAAALAVCAVFTRATGMLLIIPFGWAWLFGKERRTLSRAALALAPIAAYAVWRWWFGRDFDFVEGHFFGRDAFALGKSWDAWSDAVDTLLHGDPVPQAYILIEFLGLVTALIVSALYWRRDRGLTLYGLAIVVVATLSGAALGTHRYLLSAPALFLAPARLGRNVVVDRVWTLACCLGLAILALAFSFGFWAG